MIIAIELDNIIASPVSNFVALNEVEKCEVKSLSKESLEDLKKLGHTIIIYTSRDASLGPATETWLQKNKIPYNRIVFNKPRVDLVIDRNAYKFSNWASLFADYKYAFRNL